MLTKKIQSAGLIIFCLNLLAVIFAAFNLIPFNWDIYKGFAVATALGYILFWLTLTRISNEFKHIIKLDVEANKKQTAITSSGRREAARIFLWKRRTRRRGGLQKKELRPFFTSRLSWLCFLAAFALPGAAGFTGFLFN